MTGLQSTSSRNMSIMSIAAPDVDRPALSLADRAYLSIRDRLIMLEIRPGDPIDDVQLAKELEMGRTPVREALKRLEDDRLVVAYPRRGTFATVVDITDLAHITEIRTQLEPLAASRAAKRASTAMRAELQALLDQITGIDDDSLDAAQLLEVDLEVHRAIYRAAGNPHLEDVLIRYHNLATRIFCLFLPRLPRVAGHIDEHVPMLQAIIAGDAELAGDLNRQHIAGFELAVRDII